MPLIIKWFGILMIGLGVSLLVKPDILLSWFENNLGQNLLFILAIAVRLILGIAFLISAQKSKYPVIIKFLGYAFILAAIVFIFMGQARFHGFISNLIPGIKPFAPIGGILAIAFGGFLIYAFPNKVIE